MRDPLPAAVGCMWVSKVETWVAMLANGPSTMSGSVASSHQASTPRENSAWFIWFQ